MSKSAFVEYLRAQIDELRRNGGYRELVTRTPVQRGFVSIGGKEVLSFGSNDYLGFSGEDQIKNAMIEACQRGGVGSTGSRLLSGHREVIEQCEASISDWLRHEACLLFNSGFQANIGAIPSLVSEGDCVVFDRDVHASIIDGIKLSRADRYVFPPGDTQRARELATRAFKKGQRILLITESIFSMNGAVAPLVELNSIANDYGALLYVDEAHALGVWGEEGRGVCDSLGIKPDILVGTAGKALGSVGAFVVGQSWLRDLLINRARSFMFSTANPAAYSAAIIEGIKLCRSEVGEARRVRLKKSIRKFGASLEDGPINEGAPIFSVPIGSNEGVMRLSQALLDNGYWVPGIRAPTVKVGSERLRISLTSEHSDQAVMEFSKVLRTLMEKVV